MIRLVRRDLTSIQLGVIACVVAATGLAAVYLPRAVRSFQDGAATNSALSYDDREFAGGNGIVVDKAALYEARGLIPENESYRVVTGSRLGGATSLTLPFIESFAQYFLMPRRPQADARWIICYGCDPASLPGDPEVVWKDSNGIRIERLPG